MNGVHFLLLATSLLALTTAFPYNNGKLEYSGTDGLFTRSKETFRPFQLVLARSSTNVGSRIKKRNANFFGLIEHAIPRPAHDGIARRADSFGHTKNTIAVPGGYPKRISKRTDSLERIRALNVPSRKGDRKRNIEIIDNFRESQDNNVPNNGDNGKKIIKSTESFEGNQALGVPSKDGHEENIASIKTTESFEEIQDVFDPSRNGGHDQSVSKFEEIRGHDVPGKDDHGKRITRNADNVEGTQDVRDVPFRGGHRKRIVRNTENGEGSQDIRDVPTRDGHRKRIVRNADTIKGIQGSFDVPSRKCF